MHFVAPTSWRLGTFEVDLETGELRQDDRKVRLQEKPLRMLAALVERPGQIVTRDELRQRLWPADVFVDFDHGLHNAANKLRHALGDSAGTPGFIETVGRRGYRYVGPSPERIERAWTEQVAPPETTSGAQDARPTPVTPAAGGHSRGWLYGGAAVAVGALGILVATAGQSGDRLGRWLPADGLSARTAGETRGLAAPTAAADSPAYETYLKGLFVLEEPGPRSLQKAEGYFEQAIALDQNYAPAYAGLALTKLRLETFGTRSPLAYEPEVRAAVTRALELDPDLPEAHAALANSRRIFDWDWAGAEDGFKRAIELNPGFLTAHTEYEYLLLSLARLDGAIGEAQRATALDSRSAISWVSEGRAFHAAGRYAEAEARFRKALELHPGHPTALQFMVRLRIDERRPAEARAFFDELARQPEAISVPLVAYVEAQLGNRDRARSLILGRSFPKQAGMLAMAWAAIGDRDRVFAVLEASVPERSIAPSVLLGTVFDAYRQDPRFASLLRRFLLPEASIATFIDLPNRYPRGPVGPA